MESLVSGLFVISFQEDGEPTGGNAKSLLCGRKDT